MKNLEKYINPTPAQRAQMAADYKAHQEHMKKLNRESAERVLEVKREASEYYSKKF